jgi:hypothetical protein
MHITRILKRFVVFLACLAGSGTAPFLALFALKDVARFGSVALAVVSSWLLALLALLVIGLAWVSGVRLGRAAAIVACNIGMIALFAYPVLAATRGQEQWLSEFTGALVVELLAMLPSIILATHVASYHASAKFTHAE